MYHPQKPAKGKLKTPAQLADQAAKSWSIPIGYTHNFKMGFLAGYRAAQRRANKGGGAR